MKDYNHKDIEAKWQAEWAKSQIYRTTEDSTKPKAFVLDMFPYPSGEGLHVGHPKGYIATDVYSRHKRMTGHNVLHPMGWDAFGLPAENYALKTKTHPKIATDKNVSRYKEQLEIIGFDYDWDREINTTDPNYYKWTQWIFTQLFEKGLAYESHAPINWCPSCQTGLANEDLESDGTCERCGSKVEQRPMRQWVLKITDYADRLVDDLEMLPKWPTHIKDMQRHWIGRSEGAEIDFELVFNKPEFNEHRGPNGEKAHITVFTTRPDTLFGATFMVLAPEHPWVTLAIDEQHKDVLENRDEVISYVAQAKNKTDLMRQESKEKTGVKIKGIKAINPATKEEIPVFIADYVLASYGHGAIMAVPAHDERDYEFAQKYDVPIKQVIAFESGIKRENEERRNGGCSVVFDPKTQKYGVAMWNHGVMGLFSGGLDDGEAVHAGILRELEEESGLHACKHVEEIGAASAHYFNVAKRVNRVADATCLLVILEHADAKPTKKESHETFELGWVTAQEVLDNWKEKDTDGNRDHWVWFMKQAVARAIELGYDTTSDPSVFIRQPHTGSGVLVNSGEFSGMESDEAKQKITEFVGGTMTKTYRLQDWVFSRQRYWGEPIPIIHCEKCGPVAVPEKDLPVKLPEVEHYEPTGTGESPLAGITEWVNVDCPQCGGAGKRETNTMPQWAGSCWYYLRFMDPHNNEQLVAPDKEKYWAPVDMYVGGAEHATRHLIYARFWHKFLYDIGAVTTEEPFMELHSVGLIQAEDGRKMSKRWGNVINPDDVIAKVGADSFRVYEMFMGPFENAIAWSTDALVGARRFVERVWRLQDKVQDEDVAAIETELHKTIKKVGDDIDAFKFNTAISQMMILLNAVDKAGAIGTEQYKAFIQILAPFAPHMADELWSHFAEATRDKHAKEEYATSVHLSEWPQYDEAKLVADTITLAVQVNGKTRTTVEVASDIHEDDAKEAAHTAAAKWVDGKEVVRVIYVPGRLVNIVIKA